MARAKTPGTATPAGSRYATTPAVNPSEPKKNLATDDLEAEIRRRAYELYEQRGYTPGHENEDWLVAEQEILARHDHQQSA